MASKGKGAGKERGKHGKDLAAVTAKIAETGAFDTCKFFNSKNGCLKGNECPFKHECLICPGEAHSWSARHNA